MRKHLIGISFFFWLWLQGHSLAWCQSVTTGAIEGKVYDGSKGNAPVAFATVEATHLPTGRVEQTTTNAQGRYTFLLLAPGTYSLHAAAPGYREQEYAASLAVHLARSTIVNPPPIILVSTTTITVNTSTPRDGAEQLVNTRNATRGANFDVSQLSSLPLPNWRSVDALALLTPGVALPPQTTGHTVGPGVGPGVGTSGQFSVNGLRSRANNFTVDGADNNDEDIGVRRQGFTALQQQSLESLQEFQVATLLPEAQFRVP